MNSFSQRRRSANGTEQRNPERERHGARLRYCGARREEGKDKPALLVSCVSLFCRRSLLALCQPYGFFYRPQWRIDAQVRARTRQLTHFFSLSLSLSLSFLLQTRTSIYTTLSLSLSLESVLRHFFIFNIWYASWWTFYGQSESQSWCILVWQKRGLTY